MMLSIRLLEGLTDEDRKLILAKARTMKFAGNAQLCTEGKSASQLFLMNKGEAKYYRVTKSGKQVILYWSRPGDTFGLATLLPHPLPYIASAEAVSKCEVSLWTHATMQRLAQEYQLLKCNALRIVLLYLSFQTDRHSGILSGTAKERLAKTLVNLGMRNGSINPAGVDLDITNEQLASPADVSPFTVSRILNEWKREGAVTKRRKACTYLLAGSSRLYLKLNLENRNSASEW